MLAPIVEIFCDRDDFCKQFLKAQSAYVLPNPGRQRDRESQMSLSEITTIVVLFHMSHYRTFKHFYQDCVVGMLPSYFPQVVSYSRFIELMPSALTMMTAYLLSKSGKIN